MKKDFKIDLSVLFPGLQGQRHQKGVSLYLAIIILSIFLGISLGLSLILITQIKMIRGMEESVMAFYAADAGIERMLFNLSPSYGPEILPNRAHFFVQTFCSLNFASDCPAGYEFKSDCEALKFCIDSIGSVDSVGFFKTTKRGVRIEY